MLAQHVDADIRGIVQHAEMGQLEHRHIVGVGISSVPLGAPFGLADPDAIRSNENTVTKIFGLNRVWLAEQALARVAIAAIVQVQQHKALGQQEVMGL